MFWRGLKARPVASGEALLTAMLLYVASLPVAASLTLQTDWRGFILWTLMWPLALVKRGVRRNLLLGFVVIPSVLVLLFQMIRPPAAEFFMLIVLVLSACEQVQEDGRPGAFNLIGIIFPALCAMVLSNNVFLFLLLLVSVIFYTGVFTLRINHMPLSGLRIRLLPIVVALSGALFFAVAAFILMPRMNVASLPGFNPDKASSGVGEELDMGRFADVILNGEDAFRAFMRRPMASRQLYWRVHVLTEMTGARWHRSPLADRAAGLPDFSAKLDPPRQTVETVIRHAETAPKWHPVLGVPVGQDIDEGIDSEAMLNPQGEFVPRRQLSLLDRQVRMLSTPDNPYRAQLEYTILIDGQPRLTQWARQTYAESGSRTAFAEAIMHRFQTGGYQYTLKPPKPAGDDNTKLDQFFFETKLGYCSHYAMSMATALRAAGIPANVIIGYYGGEWNGFGSYYRLRQSDAHAWVEAEMAPGQWHRFDPTQIVPTGRAGFTARQQVVAQLTTQSGWRGTLARTMQRADAFIVRLNSDIILYDEAARQELLSGTMLGRLVSFVGFWLFASLAFIVPILAWRWWARRDRLMQIEHGFNALAKKRGLVRAPHEGRLAFAARWSDAYPAEARIVAAFSTLLCRMIYDTADSTQNRQALAEYLRGLRQFKPEG